MFHPLRDFVVGLLLKNGHGALAKHLGFGLLPLVVRHLHHRLGDLGRGRAVGDPLVPPLLRLDLERRPLLPPLLRLFALHLTTGAHSVSPLSFSTHPMVEHNTKARLKRMRFENGTHNDPGCIGIGLRKALKVPSALTCSPHEPWLEDSDNFHAHRNEVRGPILREAYSGSLDLF